MSNNLGRSLSFTYSSGLLTQATDDTGRSVSYGYDAAGNLTSFVDTLGQTTTYVYDLPGRLTQIFHPATPGQPFVTNSYDALSRVQTQTRVTGAVWQYFLAGSRAEEVDPLGMRHVLYTTPHSKTRTEIMDWQGPRQTVSTTAYDALDRVTLATAPEGNTVGYTYDLASNPLIVTRTPKPGSGLSALVTTTTYDPTYNKPLTVTDPRGLVTRMTYDAATGNLLAVVADSTGLAVSTHYTWNPAGLPLTVTDPNGTVTQNSYDAAGNLAATVRDAGTGRLNLTTAWTWNARGDPLTVTDPRGNVTASTYDAGRRVLTTTTPATSAAPAGIVSAYTYDPAGRVTQTQQSSQGTVLRTTSATWTLSGKPATATDANGNVTRFAYDLLDRQTSVTDPLGRVTTFAYDALSRPTATYNTAIQTAPLLQQTWTGNGQRASLTDAAGSSHTTTFAYDGFDRLATTTYPGGTTEAAGYDADGNVLSRTTRAGVTLSFCYDGLNRLTRKYVPAATTCTSAPSGQQVDYAYDRTGRLTGVSDNSASIAAVATPGSTTTYTTAYAYDPINRLTGVSFDPAPTPTLPATASSVTFSQGYNAANQRSSLAVTDNTWINYPSASASTTNYTANTLNQYTAVGGASPAYDDNGNLTDDGSTYKFEYDAENRLTKSKTNGGSTIGAYSFDGRGRRTSKTVSGTTTIFVTDADNREVLEYDGTTGAIQRWYPYGLGPNDVLGQMNVAASTRSTPVPDLLGSIIGSMDASSGMLTSFEYRPYGSTTSPPSQFGYTGQRIDAEVALYYYRARHYSPAWGRFLQADLAGYAAGLLLYAYVANDPLNLFDPFGLSGQRASALWNAFVAATTAAAAVTDLEAQ